VENLCVDLFPGISGTELQQYAAYADAYDGADLEQLQADRIHLRLAQAVPFSPSRRSASISV
jgi:hypothetical protein